MARIRVVVEAADKRVFATAIDWPGWSRGAKTRDDALAALVDYAARYKKSVGAPAKTLSVPSTVDDLDVIERLKGDSGTDYGIPSAMAKADRQLHSQRDLDAQVAILKAAWRAFEKAAENAHGKELAKGPRGGGRTLAKIRDHVVEAETAYVGALGAKSPPFSAGWKQIQDAMVDGLHAKLRGELPERGPRGGERWPAAYAIRRSAWHALDHAWEIEDRSF